VGFLKRVLVRSEGAGRGGVTQTITISQHNFKTVTKGSKDTIVIG
jgi:hypothetical protein